MIVYGNCNRMSLLAGNAVGEECGAVRGLLPWVAIPFVQLCAARGTHTAKGEYRSSTSKIKNMAHQEEVNHKLCVLIRD